MFNKKRETRKALLCPQKAKAEFQLIMRSVGRYYGEVGAEETEKSLVLEFAINQLGREIAVEGNSPIIRGHEPPENSYYLLNEILLEYVPEKRLGKKYLDICKCNVYTGPWKREKVLPSLRSVFRNGFHQSMGHTSGRYFPEINFAVTTGDGRHHTTAGVFLGECIVEFDVISLRPYFEKVTTDGAYFYCTSEYGTTEKVRVFDVRLAAMFALAQKRFRLSLPEVREPMPFVPPTEPLSDYSLTYRERDYWKFECNILQNQKAVLKDRLEKLQAPEGWTPEEREKQWEAEHSSMQEEIEKLRGELKHLLHIL